MTPSANSGRSKQKRRSRGASGSAKLGAGSSWISDAVRPLLVVVTQLHQLKRERRPPPELAYQQTKALLAQTVRRLESGNVTPDDVKDIRYALVAFIDEIMQAEPGALKEFWVSHLLQLELFGETRAGEGFFERLERAKAEGRGNALRVFYLCLLFGFHGIYGQHGELERENLIDGVRHALDDSTGLLDDAVLAPHGARPDEPGADRERNRLLQWLAVAAASMAVVWYVGLVFAVDAQERTLSDALEAAYEDLSTGLVAPSNY